MMVDINGFKEINDVFGHLVGDQVLMECADIIKTATRESEMLSPYCGDEFVILLHENSDHAKTANAFIGRIEKFLAERNAKAGDDGPIISLSYGHTALYSNSDIVEADKNMYLDKAARKNNR